jgi:GNAT superfamily N-acetyltransferase
MNKVIIRLCQLEHIACILEIRKRTFLHFAPSVYSSNEVKTLLEDIKVSELEEMIENKSLFVAGKGHKIIGCGGWHGESVRHMYVLPEETKEGIGRALLRVLEKDYRNRTQNSIIKAGFILYARYFYEKNGYEFLKIDTDWDGSKFNRMQKKLY